MYESVFIAYVLCLYVQHNGEGLLSESRQRETHTVDYDTDGYEKLIYK
jgi:hypothetical protein